MKFTLHYRGRLKANGKPKDKQELRQYFHAQLKDLWCRPPLGDQREWLDSDYELNVLKEVDGWTFASIINAKHHLVATLNVTLLRPENPGKIVTQGGDIDNRLKTLLDALSIVLLLIGVEVSVTRPTLENSWA